MIISEKEKKFWLDGDDGLAPYLRLKDNGMPQNKINQIAWLLLCGSGCGFCQVCRDESCNIKDGEKCTTNIANYIKSIVLSELKQEIRANAIDEFAELLHNLCGFEIDNIQYPYLLDECRIDEIAEQLKAGVQNE